MTRKISGRFNGTGLSGGTYLCLGFIPDWIRVWSNQAEIDEISWVKDMTSGGYEGILVTGATRTGSLLAKGAGIIPYAGGELMTSSNQTSVAWGDGIYLAKDPIQDYKSDLSYGVAAPVTKWTLGNAGNNTGNFDQALLLDSSTGRIEVGSRVLIRAPVGSSIGGQFPTYDTFITALTNAGTAANEVTLGQSVPTGDVLCLGGVYTYAPLALGKVSLPGVKLNIYTNVNVNNEVQFFEAGLND